MAGSKITAIFFLILYAVLLYLVFTMQNMLAMYLMAIGMFLEACEGVYHNFFKHWSPQQITVTLDTHLSTNAWETPVLRSMTKHSMGVRNKTDFSRIAVIPEKSVLFNPNSPCANTNSVIGSKYNLV
jgi:hypothetical protein